MDLPKNDRVIVVDNDPDDISEAEQALCHNLNDPDPVSA